MDSFYRTLPSFFLIRDQSLTDCISINEDKFLGQKSVPDLAAFRHVRENIIGSVMGSYIHVCTYVCAHTGLAVQCLLSLLPGLEEIRDDHYSYICNT